MVTTREKRKVSDELNAKDWEHDPTIVSQGTNVDISDKIPVCKVCARAIVEGGKEHIVCFGCQDRHHIKCIGLSKREYKGLISGNNPWCCSTCINRKKENADSQNTKSCAELCNICGLAVLGSQLGLYCEDKCCSWYHAKCLGITRKRFKEISGKSESWSCNSCRMDLIDNLPDMASETPDKIIYSVTWGEMSGQQMIMETVLKAYSTISTWIPNFFFLPSGKEGKEFIEELIITLQHFIDKSACQSFSLTSFLIMIPLLLQKPSKKSKTSENKEHLKRRLEMWRKGKLSELLSECELIQKRLTSGSQSNKQHNQRVFTRLMLQGKVNSAMRWLSTKENGTPVEINEETLSQLKAKHPKAQPLNDDCLLEGPLLPLDIIQFECLDEDSIYKAAKELDGSGGPSGVNADGIRRILCSKSFGKLSSTLCYKVAQVARRLCTEDVDPCFLTAFTSCRLIPLSKDSGAGIRPIGIGEVIRRIIGKAIMRLTKPEVLEGAGSLQVCSGQDSGSEAAIHAVARIFDDPQTECVMLVDATNAFNCLNRAVALHNVQYVCPPLSAYLRNTYGKPAELYISGSSGRAVLQSEEGTTQGDPAAMAWYAISTVPMIHRQNHKTNCHQVWFADDCTAAGKLSDVHDFWEELAKTGPGFGYFPNPRKTILIVKDGGLTKAKELFENSGVIITAEGQRHLGAVIGSENYKSKFLTNLVKGWTDEVTNLAEIAKIDPHSAYTCFTYGLQHKWSYFQRTIKDTAEFYQPLEDAIRAKLIPSIIGRNCSDVERKLFALPCRLGGLGIPDPTSTARKAYMDSVYITTPLVEKIVNKDILLDENTQKQIRDRKKERMHLKEEISKESFVDLMKTLPDHLRRTTKLNSEKGASCWLTSLPLVDCGFYLNKRAFVDAICLRYNWRIEGMARVCSCGEINTVNHALICPKGGYVVKRHNEIRDIEAELLDEVCSSVEKEPKLLPLTGEIIRGNKTEEARLDVSAVGFWRPQEKMFVDVRVFDPNCKTYKDMEPPLVYKKHENAKKVEYNDRVINVERGTFTPLIFSTTGGWGKECSQFHRHLARLIAERRNEKYDVVMNYIRKRTRFSLLRTTLEALRGCRVLQRTFVQRAWRIVDLDLDLIKNQTP